MRQRLLSLKEAACYLGRGEDSMRELVYARKIQVIQEGERSKIWLDLKDLDQWIEANKQTRYLEMGVHPVAPDQPTYPRVFENTILAFLVFAGIYLMTSLKNGVG